MLLVGDLLVVSVPCLNQTNHIPNDNGNAEDNYCATNYGISHGQNTTGDVHSQIIYAPYQSKN